MEDLASGTVLGNRYVIGKFIGSGGLGRAYSATDDHLFKRQVAIKVIHSQQDQEKYMREAEALTRIRHPGVAASYDWGLTAEGYVYTVSEMITGLKEMDRIIPKGGMDFTRAARLIRQLGQALSAIHDSGVIHQDLFLTNVAVRDEGTQREVAMILDFGKCKLKGEALKSDIWGATRCWPPEQFRGVTNERSDIYSLAAITYEMLTDRPPGREDLLLDALDALSDWVAEPRAQRPELSSRAERILLRALCRDPEKRYERAETFGNELSEALALGEFAVRTPPSRLSVFLSHASEDKERVRELFWRLQAEGLDTWFDEVKLLPGQDWRLEIQQAVRRCDAVIVCLSPNSVSKEGYFQKEVREALDVAEEKPEGAIFLIPLRLEACAVPVRLARWQWVDYFNDRGYASLLDALRARARAIG